MGSDHRGFELKQLIRDNFVKDAEIEEDIKLLDLGCYDSERTDYPLYTLPVCLEVLQGSAQAGILFCGTGIGMSIAANRFSHIYAGIAWNEEVARRAKEDDNVNILVLPADYLTFDSAAKIINVWLKAEFKGGRYKARLDMIDSINEETPSLGGGCCK